MKVTLIFFFAVLICTTKVHSINHYAPGDSVKVILACATNDQNIVNSVKQILRDDSLVTYITFCPAHAVFLFQRKGDQQSAINYTSEIRKKSSLSENTLFLKGFDFGDILTYCPPDLLPVKERNKKK